MTQKFHINNEGEVGKCGAVFQCPFGDLTNDHYSTKEEALEAQEVRNAQKIKAKGLSKVPRKRLGNTPIKRTPSKIRLSPGIAEHSVDYEYDGYDCSEYGGCTEDYCHQQRYTGLRISGWATDDGIANYTRDYLGLSKNEEFPETLKEQMTPYAHTVLNDFKIETYRDYYGESITIDPPEYLRNDLEDYYWGQPNAVDNENALSHLREKGFETQGLRPLEAVKTYVAEKHGKKIPDVDECSYYRKSSIALKNIDKPRKSIQKSLEKDAKDETAKTGRTDKIRGIVIEKDDGRYELIDGEDPNGEATSRRKGNYLILSNKRKHRRLYSR